MANKSDKIKVPFKLRFKTWWKGYDLEDVKQRMLAHEHGQGLNEEEGGKDDSLITADRRAPATLDEEISVLPWGDLRIKMTQLIWGDGYCGPGGRKQIETMSKLLAMNGKMSALVVGAGLGGPSRVLTEEYGVWVTGYELSKELAERAMQLSVDAGLASKAAIEHLDVGSDKPFNRSFDRAFSKEALYCFPDKEKIVRDIYETLKHGALFLITDYTVSDLEVLKEPEVKKWLSQESIRPFPDTAENMKSILEATGFKIRVNEDISEEYIDLIQKSWSRAAEVAKGLATKGSEGLQAVNSLMEEAEFWALRARLLKAGHIKVWRFLAHKPNEEIR